MDFDTNGTTVQRETVASGTPMAGIDVLPDEVLIQIFSYLPLGDLAWCSHTCRRWRAILREEKSLWRHRQCVTSGTENVREVLAVAGAVPRLETLYLLYCGSFGIHIAWPEATVFHYYGDAPLTWEPYFKCFDTECLVIDHSMQKNIFFYLSWVNCLTLRRIFVVEQSYFCSPYSCTRESSGLASEAGSADIGGRVSMDGPIQLVRHARSDLLSGRCLDGSTTEVHEVSAVASGAETAVCPALEEVNVYSKYIWDEHLENLCGLGPLRALHVRCQRLHSLTFVRYCRSTLEELAVADCRRLLEDAFAELCCLEKLRVLQLSDCRVEAWTIGSYVANLPHLESFLINGREALQKYCS